MTPLTNGERKLVMMLAATGDSNQKIADELHRSVKTIKTEMDNIRRKLRLTNRTQIVVWAWSSGMIKKGSIMGRAAVWMCTYCGFFGFYKPEIDATILTRSCPSCNTISGYERLPDIANVPIEVR